MYTKGDITKIRNYIFYDGFFDPREIIALNGLLSIVEKNYLRSKNIKNLQAYRDRKRTLKEQRTAPKTIDDNYYVVRD
jgi:hypothetical protein